MIFADPAVILNVSDRLEHRIRFQEGADTATDFANVPSVTLGLHDRRYDGWLSTYPLVAVHDLQSSNNRGALAMAQGSAGFAWHDRRMQIVASQSGSYGLQNFAYLLPLNLPPGTIAPPTTPVPTSNGDFLFANSQSMLSINYRWTRRFSTYVSPMLTIGGGIDDKKKDPALQPSQYLPFQVTPRLDLRLDYLWSHSTRLETFASGYAAAFDDRRCDYNTGGAPSPLTSLRGSVGTCKSGGQEVELGETWRHALSKSTEIAIGAGGSIARTRIDAIREDNGAFVSPIPERTRFFPVITAHFSHRLSFHRPEVSRIEFDARLGPIMDLRFGWIDPRITFSIRDITYYKKIEIRGSVEFAQTIPPDEPISTTFLQGIVEALYPLSRRFYGGGGLRLAWQQQTENHTTFPSFLTNVLYGTVVWREPGIYLVGGRPPGQLRTPRPEL